MLIKVFGAAVQGIDAFTITIEVYASRGIRFFLVGLPDNAVRESHERIVSALQSNGYKFPTNQIVINMAPADIRKEGAAYDLPLAVAILAVSKVIDSALLERFMIMGELSLDGGLQPIKGALSIAIKAKEEGYKGVILPYQNGQEAAVVEGIDVYGVRDIKQVVSLLNGDSNAIQPITGSYMDSKKDSSSYPDFADVKGQEALKRALEVAAAGGHNIIMIGPPGSGKSMMAHTLPSILPPLSTAESLETTRIHSVAGLTGSSNSLIYERPFRHPHHTISSVALTGGGVNAQPGEISLAHNGILYLDELPHFSKTALEILRQPLEDRRVVISRAKYSVEYPASFMLVASMNPCPCGYYNHPHKACGCSPTSIERYLNRISGPLMDRFDIHCEIEPVGYEEMLCQASSENSNIIRERVIRARAIQDRRFAKDDGIYCNSQMGAREIKRYAKARQESIDMAGKAMQRMNLSARAYNRILKLGRTIADLANSEWIEIPHIAEAISYRSMDRENWGK